MHLRIKCEPDGDIEHQIQVTVVVVVVATSPHFGSSHLNGGLRTHLLAVLRYGRATGIESTAFGGGEGLAFPLLRSQSHETRNPMRHP